MSKKILICFANPKDKPSINETPELKEISTVVAQHNKLSIVAPNKIIGCISTYYELYDSLSKFKPNIVHFIGHGQKEGLVFRQYEDAKRHIVSNEELADTFQKFSQYVECVYLSACDSTESAKFISKHIDYVIGMESYISDYSGQQFSGFFYNYLQSNQNFDYENAFNHIETMRAKYLKQDKLNTIPKIFKKSDNLEISDYNQQQKPLKNTVPCLQIALYGGENTKNYGLVAWVDNKIIHETNTSLENLPNTIQKILSLHQMNSVIRVAIERLTIEFFLPKHLLNHDIEYCKISQFDDPIGINYKVIIRSLDRLENTGFLHNCCLFWNRHKEKLQSIPENCCWDTEQRKFQIASTNSLIWIDKIEKMPYLDLHSSGVICLIFPSKPENNVLFKLIKKGFPIILWFRKTDKEYFLDEQEILDKELKFLPELIWQKRNELWDDSDETKLGDFSLLWDDADTLPLLKTETFHQLQSQNDLDYIG
ncbi:CHAT domain-containing protein [Candidatus Albibeggiatoa sp. nov. BB20]|uniref:VMAP-C domain-containing protein n=1 Tax=Candidatus Albibeggiatoa sp. nov. BB20 TaxID=3162723 RepID=UPI0033655146